MAHKTLHDLIPGLPLQTLFSYYFPFAHWVPDTQTFFLILKYSNFVSSLTLSYHIYSVDSPLVDHQWPKRPNSIKLLSDLNLLIFLLCLKTLTNLFFTEASVISWLSWYWVFLVYPLILQIFHFSPWVEFLSSVQTSNVNFQSHQQKTTRRKTVWNKSPKCFPREVREYVICFHFTLCMFCFSLMRITSGFFLNQLMHMLKN